MLRSQFRTKKNQSPLILNYCWIGTRFKWRKELVKNQYEFNFQLLFGCCKSCVTVTLFRLWYIVDRSCPKYKTSPAMTSIGVLFKFIFSQTTPIKSFSKSNFLLSYYIITVVIVLLVTALQMMGLKLFKAPFYFQNKILKYKSVQNLISNKTALKKKMMLFKKKWCYFF